MIDIPLLKLAHLLCLVYWLGGDLGVFYSSFFVADEKRSPETRVAAAKILFALDQAPRLCMPLILGLGVHLAVRLGMIRAPFELVLGTWLLVAAWVGMVLVLHFKHGGKMVKILMPIDFWFRGVFVASVTGLCLWNLFGQGTLLIDWASWKLLLFAATVMCGLMIRVRLRPFAPAFMRLKAETHDASDNAAIRRALTGTRPFVIAIWVALLLESALGVHVF
jgi:hypothetical protein